MRLSGILIFSLLILCAGSGHAAPVSRDQANEYYKSCMAQPHMSIKPDSLTALCACASAQVMEIMTSENLVLAQNNTPETLPLRHKILTDIYAPCTEPIAADLIDVQCVNNRGLDGLENDFDIAKVCSCAAEMGAQWYRGKSQRMMAEILNKTADIKDPAQALLEHPLMKSQILNNVVSCDALILLTSQPPAPQASP